MIRKILIPIFLCFSISSCSIVQGIFVAPIAIVTSPKVLVQRLRKDYKKEITVDFLVDDKPYQITAEINCINRGSYFNSGSYSWEPRWEEVVTGSKIDIGNKKYELLFSLNTDWSFYRNRVNWGACDTFLKDDHSINMVNDDNSLVMKKDINSLFKNSATRFVYFVDVTEKNKENSLSIKFKIPSDNIKIKSFKIH